MNIEEIRWDILEELEYRKNCAAKRASDEDYPQSSRDIFEGQSIAYSSIYHFILHYGEDDYERIL